MVIPQPQQREGDRPSFITGGAQCAKTAGDQTCGGNGGNPANRSGNRCWNFPGVKDGELIPAKLFNHLVTWLQARQTLSQQNTPTLESLQMTLKTTFRCQ